MFDAPDRARQHAALGDETRLRIADSLAASDRSPGEIGSLLDVPSNLLAHHLGVLEEAGIVRRVRSEGDRRRWYVQLQRPTARVLGIVAPRPTSPVLFVCTGNSARSQLAAAWWNHVTGLPAESAGTRPDTEVHPLAVATARDAGLSIASRPRSIEDVSVDGSHVITVCDRVHESIALESAWWHWSIPDPAVTGEADAFGEALTEIRDRIDSLGGAPWN